ncbi:DUF2169 domain-containing protein [Duganella violaceipulchra]|uniref:DUF2169 domain-containing protein n=1 Tax=Duganella violaceipulchra TaxID=2849652 RepID=A0AA41H5D9_9BURK|nr:DUF2169 domain-containing protein [Duganella violaceicalia]MBV6320459.1 DUF2169 domain-containing protein [Duganella violaceicalia]MCP2012294.1 hypothetical protein [Duganella violaceicalia]
MNVVNHTPFPAQAFEAIDQHEQRFHVFVLRQTFDFSSGKLEYADEQAPLCDTDMYFGEGFSGGVRQESDYCPYKPKCDVIVNAVAYAPKGKAVTSFLAGLNVVRDGQKLIEKVLRISGRRHLRKRASTVRFLQWLVKWGTFWLLQPNPWKLTNPELINSLPLRAEYAYGGECRIEENDPVARRVPLKNRLTAEQAAAHPDAHISVRKPPLAHVAYESNVHGVGFAPEWYLKATKTVSVAAPQVENLQSKITASQFWHARGSPSIDPAGLGIRSKTHPARRAMLGEVDDVFVNSNAPLPKGFDFEIWNAAPPDQQVDFLTGADVVELINLCPANTPCLRETDRGNTLLRLILPEHECFLLMQLERGDAYFRPLLIDTVIVEPENHQLALVWRAAISVDEISGIDLCEFRMRTFFERDLARCNENVMSRTTSDSGATDEVVAL